MKGSSFLEANSVNEPCAAFAGGRQNAGQQGQMPPGNEGLRSFMDTGVSGRWESGKEKDGDRRKMGTRMMPRGILARGQEGGAEGSI
jgi:hypothetical protein